MTLTTPTKFARQCGITKQAVFKSIDAGLIPFTLSGKKKLIDTDHPDVIAYAQSNSRQREDAKKNDASPPPILKQTSEQPERIMAKQNNPSKLPEGKSHKRNNQSDVPDGESKYDAQRRKAIADARIAEKKADHAEKHLLHTGFISNVLIRYIEKLNSNVERTASVFVTDMGKQIISDGEVLPRHIEKFTADILALTDDTKKALVKEIDNYEPQL